MGKPSDTAVRASARSVRRCAASFSAEGTVSLPWPFGKSMVLGFGTGNGPRSGKGAVFQHSSG